MFFFTDYVFDVKQFLSSVHPKVPVYVGGVSICVCFVAALTSIGASLAIVPRQVIPWTGLLLMYEWTFAIFFLLFGGYLHFIYLWAKSTATHISHLDSPDSDSEKGVRKLFQISYLTVI